MKTIEQHDERDCGVACLAMIAEYYDLKYPLSKLRELTKTDLNGTNLYGMVDGAQKIGLVAEALKGSLDELLVAIKDEEIQLPITAHIVLDNTSFHYIVIYKYGDTGFSVIDPAKGKRNIDFDSFSKMWTGYVITYRPSKNLKKGNYKKGSIKKYFDLMKGQYKKLTGVILISTLIAGIGILGSFVFKLIMDNYMDTGYSEVVGKENSRYVFEQLSNFVHAENNINIIFISLIGLYLIGMLVQIVRGRLLISLSKKLDMNLSLSYYYHLIDLPIRSVALRQSGEYLSRLSDVSSIRKALSEATLTLIIDSLMAVACGIILFVQSNILFLISLVMVLLYILLISIFRKPIKKGNQAVMESNAIVQSFFKETIDGILTIKSTCSESYIKNKTKNKLLRFIDAIVKNSFIIVTQESLAITIELIGTVIILWVGFNLVKNHIITIGTLISFYAMLAYFTQPIKNLTELQPSIQTAIVAADRLNDIFDMEVERNLQYDDQAVSFNKIVLQNVDFRYGNNELTLKNINLEVNKGNRIAIVGESGSGKTTLVKLLLKFYKPETGQILIDGFQLNSLSSFYLRKNIAYVEQDSFMFADTIKNNLLLGNPHVNDDEIKCVCKQCMIDDFIMSLPLGYDTPLDENGKNISSGQKQRLAIARALLQHPKVLIFDEATSNLDSITEMGIKQTIFNLGDDITVIIIAHRLSTIKNCDYIYVLDSGSVVESGTHTELQNKGGYYSQLLVKQ